MGTVILDSNVVIKHLEGTSNVSEIIAKHVATYNDIVASEVTYTIIRATTGKSPYELKRMRELPDKTRRALRIAYDLFDYVLDYIPVSADVTKIARGYIDRFALLPNDAIILATGVYYGMDALLTYDTDLLSLERIKKLKNYHTRRIRETITATFNNLSITMILLTYWDRFCLREYKKEKG